MLPITALLIDPRNPTRPTAQMITLTPEQESFAHHLNCRAPRASTLPDGLSIVKDDGPLFRHRHGGVGGLVCVMRDNWEDVICGPIIITGPANRDGHLTSLPLIDCQALPLQFMGGWLTEGSAGPVRMLTQLTVLDRGESVADH